MAKPGNSIQRSFEIQFTNCCDFDKEWPSKLGALMDCPRDFYGRRSNYLLFFFDALATLLNARHKSINLLKSF